jgi:hypothetical protein
MAQNQKENKSLLETISGIGGLESELLENEEVESKTEEVVVEETTEEAVEEAAVFKVWGEDEEQGAEDSEEVTETESETEEEDAVTETEEDDGIEGSAEVSEEEETEDEEESEEEEEAEEAYQTDNDEDPSDEDSEEDEVDADEVEVSADDAEDDMEDEVEDEVVGDDDGEEEEMEEMEDDGIEGSEEPDEDVDSAIDQISKTITAAATAHAMKKIEASYGSMKEDLDALCAEDDSLTEDFKTKAATIFEAAVTSKVREHVQSIEESYADYVSEEVNELHEGLIDKIDSYLTYVAEQWIEKNEVAVTNTLRTDIAEGFMASLKSTFIEHYIEMPEGKTDMFDEVAQQNAELSEDVESKEETIKALAEEVVVLKKASLVTELSEGLVDTDAAKFRELTKDIVFESADEFSKKAKIVRESYFSKKDTVTETVKSENTNTKTEVVVEEVKEESDGLSPLMSRYVNASSKLNKEAF